MIARFRPAGTTFLLTLLIAAAACRTDPAPQASAGGPSDGRASIRIASFNFPESEILAELYAQSLTSHGFSVEMQRDLGPRELVEPALQQNLIDFVPEYSGTALEFVDGGAGLATSNPSTTHQALVDAMTPRGVDVLSASPAQDQNGFAVTKTTAVSDHLQSLSDLSPDDQGFVFGGPPECRDRPLCVAGLQDVYGLTFKSFVPLDDSGPLTFDALDAGAIDVGLVFTTDPHLQSGNYVLLEDDRGLEPAENVTPVVRQEVVVREGEDFVQTVDTVSKNLTTADLVALNGTVAGGTSPEAAAKAWLEQHGLLGGAE